MPFLLYSSTYSLMLRVPGLVRPDIVVGTLAPFVLLALAFVVADAPFILAAVLPVVAAFRALLLSIVTAVLAGVIRDKKADVVDFGNRIFRRNYRGC